jgi:phage terminase large subunit-like protein
MPWQGQVLDVALEVERRVFAPCPKCVGLCEGHNQFVYQEVIVTVPRQSGKTTMMLSLILARCMGLENQRVVYTAQTRADARKKWFEEWIPVLEVSPFNEFIDKRLANGDESLTFPDTRSRQGLVASTAKAGHGQTLDMGIVDEAFAQSDSRLEQSLKPAMITRHQPPHRGAQLWIISTAGTITASPYLLGKVEAGREIAMAGLNKQVAYFEWSAPDDADPADHEVWANCMPALGRTAQIDSIEADFRTMDLHEFQRAYLNQWTTIAVDPVIPIKDWMELATLQPGDTDGIPIMLSVDVSQSREMAAIAASGRLPDGKFFVEVIKHEKYVSWVVPTLKKLIQEHDVRGLIVDPLGPSSSMIDELKDVHVQLKVTNAQEMGRACESLFDSVADYHNVVHAGQDVVSRALDGAVKRNIGDGGWGWGRRNSGVDISPLVAITLARWHAEVEGTAGAQAWDLNQIVADLRQRKLDEAGLTEGQAHGVEERPGGVSFVPL